MTTPTYQTSYHKGFLGQEKLWQRFYDAVYNVDCQEMRDIADHRKTALGAAYRQIAVDPDIFGTRTPDIELFRAPVKTPQPGSDEFHAEAKFLIELSEQRDEPLDSLTHLPDYLTKISWFLRDWQQVPYKAGVDYMKTEATWKPVQEGRKPTEQLQKETAPRGIKTGRDAARFVHDDNPFTIFTQIGLELLALGVEHRVCEGQILDPNIGRFASVGPPFLLGGFSEVGRRVGLISFREKWSKWIPRPEQYCAENGLGFLSQAFPEGSPMHPSRNAMHEIIYAAMGGWFQYVFDRYHVLPNGNTVEYEIDLLIANGGEWRQWAGVHYRSDNEPYVQRAKMLGEKVAKEQLAKPDQRFPVR